MDTPISECYLDTLKIGLSQLILRQKRLNNHLRWFEIRMGQLVLRRDPIQ